MATKTKKEIKEMDQPIHFRPYPINDCCGTRNRTLLLDLFLYYLFPEIGKMIDEEQTTISKDDLSNFVPALANEIVALNKNDVLYKLNKYSRDGVLDSYDVGSSIAKDVWNSILIYS